MTDTGDNLVDLCAAGTPSTLWAVGETGTVITSGDGGLTWAAHNLETTATLSAICAVDASTAWLAGGGGLLRKTADGCATWGSQDVGNSNNILAIYAAGGDDAWAVGENGMVIRTYDGGDHLDPAVRGRRALLERCLRRSPRTRPGRRGRRGPPCAPRTAASPGAASIPAPTGNLYGVASPGPADAWLVGQDGLVLRTWDGGKSWEEQPSRASYDLHDVSCVDGKTAWAVGRRGTIVRTFDEGYTWYRQDPEDTEESAVDLLGVYAASASTAYAVGRGGTIIKTGDAGETWSVQESGTTSDLFSVCGSDEENVWACGKQGTLLRTSDGGRTWFPLDAGTAVDLNAVSAPRGSGDAAAIDAAQTAWIAGQDGFAARTRDGGRTWTAQDTGTANALKGVAAPDADTAYVVGARGTILHYRISPRLDAVSPSTAQAKGTITLSGLAFGAGTDSFVSFGSVKASQYAHWSERLIKVVMPPGASPREEITVTTPLGTSAGHLLIILPKLDGVSPHYCRAGKPLTIAGASFGPSQGDSYVTVGGVKVTEFEYWTNNLIRLTVPGNAPESAEVKVVTASGASNPIKVTVSRTPPSLPEIIRPRVDFLDPTSAVTGQEITIYGSGFGPSRGSGYVSFGTVKAAAYTAWANDRIVVKVPAGVVGQVKVTVTTLAGTTGALAFTAIMPPTIQAITPPSGTSGSQVEITGAAFGPREGPTSYVSVGGVRPQVYDYWSEGRIVVKVPAQLEGKVAVNVTTPTATSNTVYFVVRKADLRGASAGGGRAWAVGESGTIMRSTDGGANWKQQDSGCDLWLYGVSAGSAARVWAVGEGGVILTTSDGGSAWTRHPAGATRTLYGVDAVGATTAWAVGDGGVIMKTADGGTTWTPQASGTASALYAVSAVDASTAWTVGAGGVVLKTVDGGASWAPQNSRVTATLYGV